MVSIFMLVALILRLGLASRVRMLPDIILIRMGSYNLTVALRWLAHSATQACIHTVAVEQLLECARIVMTTERSQVATRRTTLLALVVSMAYVK
jgi:hypothetical protein